MSDINNKPTDTRRRSLSRIWIRLGLPCLFFTVIYGGTWIAAAFLLQEQARDWIAHTQADGTVITHGDLLVSGFPGRVVVTMPNWSMTAPGDQGGWVWRAPSIAVWAHPWSPLTFTVDLAGTHTLAGVWTPPDIAATLTLSRGDLTPELASGGQLRALRAKLIDLGIGTAAAPASIMTLTEGTLDIVPRPAAPSPADLDSWHVALTLSGLGLPAAEIDPFSATVQRAILVADFIGPVEPGPLARSLDAWRQSGGTLELRDISLDWPPLSAAGSGTISLDENLQPIGAATLKFSGFFETVDGLAETGAVKPSAATMARIVLGMLARTPPQGGSPELSIAVTAQDGKLYTGPLAIMDLPPVDWATIAWPRE